MVLVVVKYRVVFASYGQLIPLDGGGFRFGTHAAYFRIAGPNLVDVGARRAHEDSEEGINRHSGKHFTLPSRPPKSMFRPVARSSRTLHPSSPVRAHPLGARLASGIARSLGLAWGALGLRLGQRAAAGSRDREVRRSGANLSRAARSIAYALARASSPVRDGGVIREPSLASQPARHARAPMLAEHMSAHSHRAPAAQCWRATLAGRRLVKA